MNYLSLPCELRYTAVPCLRRVIVDADKRMLAELANEAEPVGCWECRMYEEDVFGAGDELDDEDKRELWGTGYDR